MTTGRPSADLLRRALGVIGVVGLLLAVCVGAWQLLGDRFPAAEARNVAPAGEDGRYAWDTLALAPFGENRESYVYVRTFEQVQRLKFLSEAEIAAFQEGGAGASRVVVASTLPEGKIVALVVKMRNREQAIQAADRMNEQYLAGGFQQRPDRPWVRRAELVPESPAARPIGRAIYVHGDLLARVELTGRPGADLAGGFGSLLGRQLEVLPANG